MLIVSKWGCYGNSHKTLMVWVLTTFSVSCMLSPWQMTTRDRLLGPTFAVMFDDVTHPPSGETTVRPVAFRTWRPFTIHLISAGGLLLAVAQTSGTESPTRASVGPVMVTCDGATRQTSHMRRGNYNHHWDMGSKRWSEAPTWIICSQHCFIVFRNYIWVVRLTQL